MSESEHGRMLGDRYEIGAVIGRGGMAEVTRAETCAWDAALQSRFCAQI